MNKPALNPNQLAFIKHYLVSANATEAAIKAGYSKKTAEAQGSRLLRNVKVSALIQRGQQMMAEKLEVKAADVIAELKSIGFANAADYYDFSDGTPHLDMSNMTRAQSAAIASIKTKTYCEPGREGRVEEVEIKFHSKPQALDKLGKHLGLFEDKVKHEHAGEVNIIVKSPIPGAPGSMLGQDPEADQ